MIGRMEPLVSKCAGTLHLGQIDHTVAALVVGDCSRQALATRAECQSQIAVQAQRLGRHAQNIGKIQQAIVGVVHYLLALVLVVPQAELDTSEAKGLGEVLGRGLAGPALRSLAHHLFRLGEQLLTEAGFGLDDLGSMLGHIFHGGITSRENLVDHFDPLAVGHVAHDLEAITGAGHAVLLGNCDHRDCVLGLLLRLELGTTNGLAGLGIE